MLIFYSDDLTITGLQIFPESSDLQHIEVSEELFETLTPLTGTAKLVDTGNGLALPDNLEAIAQSKLSDSTAADVRTERDSKIRAQMWRYERHARELRLGLTPTDDIRVLDQYIQALADLTEQPDFPHSFTWPNLSL